MYKNELKEYYMTIDNSCKNAYKELCNIKNNINNIEKLGLNYKKKEEVLHNIKLIETYLIDIDDINFLINFVDFVKDNVGGGKND